MAENVQTSRRLAFFFAVYAIAVFGIDTLALHRVQWFIDWSMFEWRQTGWARSASPVLQALAGFDFFKFVALFVIPLAICVPRLETRWFSVRQWKRTDYLILLGLMACGIIAVLSILFLPGLRSMYPSMAGLSAEQKLVFVSMQVCWIVSWLLGWEFLTRYAMLRHLKRGWPHRGWIAALLLIPAMEAAYHLAQGKGAVESAAMFAFGLVLCAWALWRENTLLPFTAHAFVEIALVLFLILI